MDLQELKFKVETAELDAAITKIDKLATTVKGLTKPVDELTKSSDKATKATKDIGEAADGTSKKLQGIGKASTGTKQTVDSLQEKLKNTFKDLAEGFTRGESSILNVARSLKATDAELGQIQGVLKDISKLIKDPFDSAIGSVRAVTKELEMMKQRASLAGEGISLTTKQLREYSRIADEIGGKFKAQGIDITQGAGLQDYNAKLRETQSVYIASAVELNKLTAAEKNHGVAVNNSAAAAKANANVGDAMVSQYRNRQAAIQSEIDKIKERANILRAEASGISAGEYQLTAMGASPDQVAAYRKEQIALQQLTQAEKDRKDALKATNVVQKDSQQAGDAMVAQYRKRQTAIQNEINKLKEQATALRASSSVTTGNVSFRLGNLGASASQIAEAKALRKEIEDLGKAARKSEAPLKGMASVLRQIMPGLGALSAGAISTQLAVEFVKIADSLTLLEARLDFLSKGTLDFNSTFSQLVTISNEARTSVQDTSVFFSRLVPIMQSVGRSTNDAFTVTESFSKLLMVSGTSSREASSAMYQLSQALGKGKLDGDEFRTMAEAVPEILRMFEKELKISRAELYKFSEQGKLTTDVIMDTLVKALPEMEKAAAGMPKTVDGALIILKNTSTELVKSMEDATKVTEGLAEMLLGVADIIKVLNDNKETVLVVMGALTGAGVAVGLGAVAKGLGLASIAAGGLSAGLAGIAALAAAHPVVAILLGVGAATGALMTYNNLPAKNFDEAAKRVKKLKEELRQYESLGMGDMGYAPQARKELEAAQEAMNALVYSNEGRNEAAKQSGIAAIATKAEETANALAAARLQLTGFKGDHNKFIGEIEAANKLLTAGLTRPEYDQVIKGIYEKYGVTKKPGSTKGAGTKAAGTKAATEMQKAMETYGDLIRKDDGYLKDFNNKQEQLNLLLNAGKISQIQYNEAVTVLMQAQPIFKKQLQEKADAMKIVADNAKAYADQLDRIAMADADVEEFVLGKRDDLKKGQSTLAANKAAFGMTAKDAAIFNREREIELQLEKEIRDIKSKMPSSEVQAAGIAELKILAEKNKLLVQQEEATKEVQQQSEQMASVFTSAFSDLISGGKSFGDVLVDLGRSIANLITEIMVLEPLKASLKSSFASSGGMNGLISAASSFLGFADGGAFSGGVQKFANGGSFTNKIVNKPTNFNIGQMGEAGPEAIMPLMRTSSGALGVQSSGSSSSNVSVVVVNNTSEKAETKETVDSKGNRRVEVMIGDMVAGEMGRSSSGIQQSMKSTFGLQPSLVRR